MKIENLITLEDHMKLSSWSSVYEFFGFCMGNDIKIYWLKNGEIKSGLIRTIRKNHSTGFNLTVKSSDSVYGLSFSSVLVKR